MSPDTVEFLRRLIADRPLERRSVMALRVADESGIGRAKGKAVQYEPGDYDLAATILTNRGFVLVAPRAGGARADAPDASSEKARAAPVARDLVGVVPIGLPSEASQIPSGSFLVIRWEAALAMRYELLVVCENLEPMMCLANYPWLHKQIAGRPALVLFRGQPEFLRTNAPARLVQSDTRPVLAMFDFDPMGLAMANALPRREGLAVPPWAELRALVLQYKRYHLYASQVQATHVGLDACQTPDIAQAWARMRGLQCGLNQEAFGRTPT